MGSASPESRASSSCRAASSFSFLSAVSASATTPLIVFRFAELDQHELVVELALDPGDAVELIFQRSPLAHDFLSAGGIVPEFRIFGLLVQLGQTHLGAIDVKDASSAVQETA